MSEILTPAGRGFRIGVTMLALMMVQCGGKAMPRPGATADDPATPADPPSSPAAVMGSALLSWQPPTERVDGSTVELSGYRVYVGAAPGDWLAEIDLDNPGLTSYLVEGLAAGTWFFTVTAVDDTGLESGPSAIASKTIG